MSQVLPFPPSILRENSHWPCWWQELTLPSGSMAQLCLLHHSVGKSCFFWALHFAHEHLVRNHPMSCHGTGDSRGCLNSWKLSSVCHGAPCSPRRLSWKNQTIPWEHRAAPDPAGPPGAVYLCTGDKLAVGHPISGLDSCSLHWPIPSCCSRGRDLPVLASPSGC